MYKHTRRTKRSTHVQNRIRGEDEKKADGKPIHEVQIFFFNQNFSKFQNLDS